MSIAVALAAVVLAARAPAAVPKDAPAAVEIAVPGDVPTYAVPGAKDDARVLVYLHGRCGDPFAGIRAFPDVAREHGTMIAVLGDVPCPDRPGRRRWSSNFARIQARIDAAVAAVSSARGAPLDPKTMTLVGYSEGALRAESLAKRFPDRYPAIVLAASPRAPSPSSFSRSQAIVTLVGERDVQEDMRRGTAAIESAGLAVRLFVLPGARHGTYGSDGAAVMRDAFAWLDAHRP